jgi:hypothetical protein
VRKHAKESGGDAGGAVEVEALEDGTDGAHFQAANALFFFFGIV